MRPSALGMLIIGGAWTLLVGLYLGLPETIFVLLFDRDQPAYGEYQFAFIWTGLAVVPGLLFLLGGLFLLVVDRRWKSSR